MIDGIAGVLPSFDSASMALSRPQATSPLTSDKADFAATLADVVGSAVDSLKQGEAAGIAGIQGQLSPQRVVEQVLAAERTLQAAIAVRDKLVGAYLEINRMQI